MMIVAMISGCGMSNEDIVETVKTSMQETFNSNSDFQEYNLKVGDIQVFKKGGNDYKGLVSVLYKEQSHDVIVEILVDGNSVMWEVVPG